MEPLADMPDMFSSHHAELQEATIDQIVEEQMELAAAALVDDLVRSGVRPFSNVVDTLLQTYMLRETNVKDICVKLAKVGRIDNTWGGGNRKRQDKCPIKLTRPGL